nr:tyrosine-type recombinase/integrase [Streptomyces buecherae]
MVVFAACTAARIGEVSGCRVGDVDTTQWIWTVRRQTTPAPGGLTDKGTKGKRARKVPIVEEIRPLTAQRILSAGSHPDARLFTGPRPRGGRISTAVPRDATHWDDVVTRLGYEHLRRHDLRHTGLTWFADAGVQLHRPPQHRRPRITDHHPALPAPGRTQAHGRRGSALRTLQRAPRTTPADKPSHQGSLTSVKDAGPQLVPRNGQGPVSEDSKTGPDLRLSRVGTTGFEPATP